MRITILARTKPGPDETFDVAVGQVAAALRRGGHRISIVGIQCHIGKLISALKRRHPDLVFNLISPPEDDGPNGPTVMGLMELLGLPYTGSGPSESMLQGDPYMIRALLDGEPVSAFPAHSNGHARLVAPAGRLAEAKLSGPRLPSACRTFRAGVLGNRQPMAFPPIEIHNSTRNGHFAAEKSTVGCLSPEIRCDIENRAAAACEPLRVRDYATMELRLNGDGRVRVAGVLPNCDLSESGEYARTAAAAGMDFVQLVNRIVELALERSEQRQLTRLI